MTVCFAQLAGSRDGVAATYLSALAGALREEGDDAELITVASEADADDLVARARGLPVVIEAAILERFGQCRCLIPQALVVLHRAPAAAEWLSRARVLASSRRAAEAMADLLPALLPPGFGSPPRNWPRLAPESVRLLAVGALVPRKGHERLIEALAGATDLDWRLTIAGEGARRDPAHEAGLRIRIDAAGLGDRIRLEMPAPDRLAALWRKADAFVLATRWEGAFPALGEAMRRGIPAVVTQPPEWVPAAGAIVVERDDTETFARALRRLVFDTRLRAALAEQAWTTGLSLPSWNEQARRLRALLCRLDDDRPDPSQSD